MILLVQVKFTEFQVTYHLRKLFIYNLFGLVWSSQFIVHLGVLIIALAIGLWYFSEQDDDDRRRQRMGSRRIVRANVRTSAESEHCAQELIHANSNSPVEPETGSQG